MRTRRVFGIIALCLHLNFAPLSFAGLSGHWSMNENTGTVVGDSSASALHGAITGPGVTWTPGILGSGLNFDASTDHVSIPHTVSLDFSTSFTLSFWINATPNQPGDDGGGLCAIIDKSHGSGGANGWVVQARAAENGAISFAIGNGTDFPEPRIPGVLDDTWHHVAILVNFTPTLSIRGFRDGVLVTDYADASNAFVNNTGPIYFGVRAPIGGSPSRQFEGRLDDVRLYDNGILPCEAAAWENVIGIHDCNDNGIIDFCESQAVDATFTAFDASAGDNFGRSVSIRGDSAIVGAYADDHAGVNAGSAYVFMRSDGVWTQQAKLVASDAGTNDVLGTSVSIEGNVAVVGASLDDLDGGTDAGSAYVFVRSGEVWTQQAKLTAADAATGDEFGTSICIYNETIVVGALRDDHAGGTDAGSAYVFVRLGGEWTQQAKLTAADAATGDLFGTSICICNETIVVGALRDDHAGGTDAGSAYVFVRLGGEWTQQAKLTAFDAATSDVFGRSVSISGDTAVVSANSDDHAAVNAGSAYVFLRSDGVWTHQAKLVASDGGTGDIFGTSVSIDGNIAVVGTNGDDLDGWTNAGSAYVFERLGTAWTQQAKVTASNAATNDQFGVSVSIDGATVVVGVLTDDHSGGTDAGSIYVVNAAPLCNGTALPDGCGSLPPGVRAVRSGALPGNGLSWAAPFNSLQGALDAAWNSGGTITELWVAEGRYRPDINSGYPLGNREATFTIPDNLAVYGGFSCGDNELSDRDPIAHPTVLSGDLLGNDGPNLLGNGENSFHVLTNVGVNVILDGFVVHGGNANGGDGVSRGGGMWAPLGNPTLRNCRFERNSAAEDGGAIFVAAGATLTLTDCGLFGNHASGFGGAMALLTANATITRCIFAGNSCAEDGGAIQLKLGGSADLRDCILNANTAGQHGGAVNMRECGGGACAATIRNCTIVNNLASFGGALHNDRGTFDIAGTILRGNLPQQMQMSSNGVANTLAYCDIQGLIAWPPTPGSPCNPITCVGCAAFCGDGPLTLGPGNIDADPLFLDPNGADNVAGNLDDNFHIPIWSPCANAGEPSYAPPPGATTDIDGQSRVQGCRIDMGVDESAGGAAQSGDVNASSATDLADVQPFVNALLSGGPNCAADINNDGGVDGRDVAFFVEALLSP